MGPVRVGAGSTIWYVTSNTEPMIMSHTLQLLLYMQPARLTFWVVVMLAISCLPTSMLVLKGPDVDKCLAAGSVCAR